MYRVLATDTSFTVPLLAPRIFFTGTDVQSAVQSTFSFVNQNIGTASSDRLVVVAVNGNNGEVVSGTINGIPTTTHVSTWSNANCSVSIISAPVPSSTSVTIDITYDYSDARCIIGIYAIYGLNSFTPVGAVSTHSSQHDDYFLTLPNLTIPAFSVTVLSYTTDNYMYGYSWTVGTNRYTNDVGGTNFQGASGNTLETNIEFTPTITCISGSSLSPQDRCIAGVCWR